MGTVLKFSPRGAGSGAFDGMLKTLWVQKLVGFCLVGEKVGKSYPIAGPGIKRLMAYRFVKVITLPFLTMKLACSFLVGSFKLQKGRDTAVSAKGAEGALVRCN